MAPKIRDEYRAACSGPRGRKAPSMTPRHRASSAKPTRAVKITNRMICIGSTTIIPEKKSKKTGGARSGSVSKTCDKVTDLEKPAFRHPPKATTANAEKRA